MDPVAPHCDILKYMFLYQFAEVLIRNSTMCSNRIKSPITVYKPTIKEDNSNSWLGDRPLKCYRQVKRLLNMAPIAHRQNFYVKGAM